MSDHGDEWLGCYAYFPHDIRNYGTSDADNMISETLTALNGKPVDMVAIYIDGSDQTIAWTSNSNGSATFQHIVRTGQSYTPIFVLHVGDGPPPRLWLSAESLDNGPFNDLIIGPPYARPALALARSAASGPGTNAVALAISSDVEFLQLQLTNWTDLARVAVTGAVTVTTDTNAAPQRFYRVLVP